MTINYNLQTENKKIKEKRESECENSTCENANDEQENQFHRRFVSIERINVTNFCTPPFSSTVFLMGEKSRTMLQRVADAVVCTAMDSSLNSYTHKRKHSEMLQTIDGKL